MDIVINNAGVSFRGQVADTTLDVDQRVMLVNYFGQVAVTKGMYIEVKDIPGKKRKFHLLVRLHISVEEILLYPRRLRTSPRPRVKC